jgi:hypothetical protein
MINPAWRFNGLLPILALLLPFKAFAVVTNFNDQVFINYANLFLVRSYAGNSSAGGGALVLQGMDAATSQTKGGAYFEYDCNPAIASDRGAIALYPLEANMAASLTIAPSGNPSSMSGEDTASLALQLQNGLNDESRFVAVMKKWGEMRFATVKTGTNSTVIPMTHYVGDWRLLEMTTDGQVNMYFKGFPVLTMTLPYGTVQWSAVQTPVVLGSVQAVKTNAILASAAAGTEVSFVDTDGLIKKAIKQANGTWIRVNNLLAL